MDMQQKADTIYHLHISKPAKIKLLQDLLLDCHNEMEAQDQNMQPELSNNSAQGYQTAQKYLRHLKH